MSTVAAAAAPAFGTTASDIAAVEVILDRIKVPAMFASNTEFNEYCRGVCAAWKAARPQTPSSELFTDQMARIQRGPNTVDGQIKIIPTPWGGVDVLRYNVDPNVDPTVHKHLVVKGGYYLAYEMHDKKTEQLWVLDGVGVLLSRPVGADKITAQPFLVGSTAQFQPGHEHCLIALSNMVVFEVSKDFLGMDKDLIFKFEPVVAA